MFAYDSLEKIASNPFDFDRYSLDVISIGESTCRDKSIKELLITEFDCDGKLACETHVFPNI